MRSVIFIASGLYTGGVERSLIGVIKKFLNDGWDVSVAITRPQGSNPKILPQGWNLYIINDFIKTKEILHTPIRKNILNSFKQHKYLLTVIYLILYISIKLTCSNLGLYKYAFLKVPMLSDKVYDLAVAFAGPDSFIDYYVSSRINAREKWGWIHFDISKYGIDRGIMNYAGKRYHRINIVSRSAKQIFDNIFPNLKTKTYHEPNIINKEKIIQMSLKPSNVKAYKPENKRIILTVGRVSKEKGQYVALNSIIRLLDRGINDFIWWFIGDGTDLERCKKYSIDNNIQDYVHFWGNQSNPYIFMKICDLYVQPSIHEGFCITLAEVKLFDKPILATNFTGAKEQLQEYKKMMIAKSGDDISLCDNICKMLSIY